MDQVKGGDCKSGVKNHTVNAMYKRHTKHEITEEFTVT